MFRRRNIAFSSRGASSCVKCGACLPACPVFEVRPREAFSPRGKMALVEAASEASLGKSNRYRDYLETCLLCGACQEKCPNSVRTLECMIDAREKAASSAGMRPLKSLLMKRFLRAASLFRLAMKSGRAAQRVAFKRKPSWHGVRRRFPMPLIPPDRLLPTLSSYFFTDLFDGVVREGDGPRVGVFSGCMVDYFYTGIGESMVNLLGRLGATVIVPEGQCCCGMPALTAGAVDTARHLALQNLEAFERYRLDAVVTGCASCGSNMKSNYRQLLAEAGVGEKRAEEFVSRLRDINQYLDRSGLATTMFKEHARGRSAAGDELAVTWHQPCHLGRTQLIREEPLKLLRSLPGVRFLPMRDADRCCGMGGSFSIEHYDISKAVNDVKVDRILETAAEMVVTSCPACIMHIRDGLRRRGHEEVRVMHIAQLTEYAISVSMGGDGRRTEGGWAGMKERGMEVY